MWFLLHQFYSEQELGVAYTIIATASTLSGVAGGPLAAELLELDGTLHLHGWQVRHIVHITESIHRVNWSKRV